MVPDSRSFILYFNMVYREKISKKIEKNNTINTMGVYLIIFIMWQFFLAMVLAGIIASIVYAVSLPVEAWIANRRARMTPIK